MSAHTPGPWVVTDATYGHPAIPTPNLLIQPVVMGSPVNRSIAKVNRSNGDAQANANLIAAAPELLKALRAMLVLYQGKRQGVLGEALPQVKSARAAIAKASGEEA